MGGVEIRATYTKANREDLAGPLERRLQPGHAVLAGAGPDGVGHRAGPGRITGRTERA